MTLLGLDFHFQPFEGINNQQSNQTTAKDARARAVWPRRNKANPDRACHSAASGPEAEHAEKEHIEAHTNLTIIIIANTITIITDTITMNLFLARRDPREQNWGRKSAPRRTGSCRRLALTVFPTPPTFYASTARTVERDKG